MKNYHSYFSWLMRRIFMSKQVLAGNQHVLNRLLNIPFYSNILLDENRAKDGELLQEEYFGKVLRPCSVLEMMIALSERMEYITSGFDMSGTPSDFLEAMLWNIGIAFEEDDKLIDERIETLLSRSYCKDGEGGLFPLRNTSRDQREVELWQQMNNYLNENFDFSENFED